MNGGIIIIGVKNSIDIIFFYTMVLKLLITGQMNGERGFAGKAMREMQESSKPSCKRKDWNRDCHAL